MDVAQIVEMYVTQQMSLREIAVELNTNHKLIGRILVKEGIKITRRNRPIVFTEEHRRKISIGCMGRKTWSEGKKMTEDHVRKNMVGKLKRSNVTLETLSKYDDIEKLKFLNNVISRHRKEFNDDSKYLMYLDKFFFNDDFNKIYNTWLSTGKNKWYMPSIDHIHPKAKGGVCDIDNITFLTWFENRAKADMTYLEWHNFKKETNMNCDLFTKTAA